MEKITITHAEWIAEAIKRFGEKGRNWKFKCPACGHIASGQQYIDAGAPHGAIGFSCIGRYKNETKGEFLSGKGGSPCNYLGGGLIQLNPVIVKFEDGSEVQAFEFAEADNIEVKHDREN